MRNLIPWICLIGFLTWMFITFPNNTGLEKIGDITVSCRQTDHEFTDFEPEEPRQMIWEQQGRLLVYQYGERLNYATGYRVCYKLRTADPFKPLVWTENVKRDERGYVISEDDHELFVDITCDNPEWMVVGAESKHGRTYKDGEPYSHVGGWPMYTNSSWNIDDDSFCTVGCPFSFGIRSQAGKWGCGQGELESEHGSWQNGSPVSEYEVVVYLMRKADYNKVEEE